MVVLRWLLVNRQAGGYGERLLQYTLLGDGGRRAILAMRC
jgi:hypothetical protein